MAASYDGRVLWRSHTPLWYTFWIFVYIIVIGPYVVVEVDWSVQVDWSIDTVVEVLCDSICWGCLSLIEHFVEFVDVLCVFLDLGKPPMTKSCVEQLLLASCWSPRRSIIRPHPMTVGCYYGDTHPYSAFANLTSFLTSLGFAYLS